MRVLLVRPMNRPIQIEIVAHFYRQCFSDVRRRRIVIHGFPGDFVVTIAFISLCPATAAMLVLIALSNKDIVEKSVVAAVNQHDASNHCRMRKMIHGKTVCIRNSIYFSRKQIVHAGSAL